MRASSMHPHGGLCIRCGVEVMGRLVGLVGFALFATIVVLGSSAAESVASPPASLSRHIPAAEDPALVEARNLALVRDFAGAVRIWQALAKRGNSRACYRLGVAYRSGRGVKHDNAKAAYWFGKAAANGDPDAQYALGILFGKGLGVEPNRARAIELLGDASRAGHRKARTALNEFQTSGSGAFATAHARIVAARKDPRAALNQSIRIGDVDSAREALTRGAPINGAPGDRKHWRPLILAIERGRPEIIALLFEYRADPDLASRMGEPALILAIRSQNRNVVRQLLAAGATPDANSATGFRPLMEAARLGLARIVEDLLAAGANPEATLLDGTSAADIARRIHYKKLARRLRQLGAPTRDGPSRLAALESTSLKGSGEIRAVLPPIIEAARRGDVELLDEIIRSGTNPATRDPEGDSALHRAADEGNVEIAEMLLRAGVNPNLPGTNETTALMRAVASTAIHSDRVVEVLLDGGADPHMRDRMAAGLIDYAAHGATARKLVLLRRAGTSWTESEARQSLEEAARAGRHVVVKALLDVISNQISRIEAVCGAIGANQSQVLDILLEKRPPMDLECGAELTALMIASQSGRNEMVSKVLVAGADPSQPARSGGTPLIAASSRGYVTIVEELIRAGAKVDAYGAHRMTALMGAAGNGHIDVVRMLLEHGADRRMRTNSGHTAAKLAEASEREDISALIESWSPGWRRWFASGD